MRYNVGASRVTSCFWKIMVHNIDLVKSDFCTNPLIVVHAKI
jgi:hypothetical protein